MPVVNNPAQHQPPDRDTNPSAETPAPDSESLIPQHGGYRNLKSFQVARLIYDVTVAFCDACIDRRSRTHDQMVQAARSGVQNIAEGSRASGTSRKMEMKLTNVGRASLEELRLDYEDYLRQHGLPLWAWNDPRRAELIARRPGRLDDVAVWVRWAEEWGLRNGPNRPDGLRNDSDLPSMGSIPSTNSTRSSAATRPEAMANGALALIAVAASLLRRQVEAQAAAFEQEGGFTERLYNHRRAGRDL